MVPTNDPGATGWRELPRAWRRRWAVVVVAVLVVLGVAVGSSLTQTRLYRSQVEVSVRPVPAVLSFGDQGPATVGWLAAEARRAERDAVVATVRGVVGTEPDLAVAVDPEADVLRFAATSSDRHLAARAVDEHARAFVAERQADLAEEQLIADTALQELAAALDVELEAGTQDERRRADLEARRRHLSELSAHLVLATGVAQESGAQVIGAASVAGSPFAPDVARRAVLALAVGLLLGLVAAWVFDRLDPSLRDEADLRSATGGVAVLAVLPDPPGRLAHPGAILDGEHPEPARLAAYRELRAALWSASGGRSISSVAVTSPDDGDERTVVAANLAVTCARAGQRVVLVDCDLHRPGVHQLFDVGNDVGFSTVLSGEGSLDSAAHRIADEPGLVVITAGPVPADPLGLLTSARARSFIASVASQADLVVLDAPPVVGAADALVVASLVDSTILVAGVGASDRGRVARTAEELRRVDPPLLGTVLTRG